MATLTGQTIASSYEQLLHVDTDGGGNTTTLVPVKDGDNGTTFCLQLSTTKAMIEGSGSKLFFSDEGGEYISGDGTTLTITAGAADVMKLDANSRISLSNNDGNTSNTVFGYKAFTNNGTVLANVGADGNVAVGELAMGTGTTTTAVYNVAIGTIALEDITIGDSNVAVGAGSAANVIGGSENIAIGRSALTAMAGDTGAGDQVNNGHRNIAIGQDAMGAVNAGDHNTATTDDNIAIGNDALLGASFSGSDLDLVGNIAIGSQALDATANNAQTGTIAIGHQALTALTGGVQNTVIGYQAADGLTTGHYNTVLGYDAFGNATTSADQNTAIGRGAMSGAIVAEDLNFCVAVGDLAMSGALDAAASGSVGIGKSALGALTSGGRNTAVGYLAATSLVEGSYNTVLGYEAFDAGQEDSSCVAIGAYALTAADVSDTGSAVNTFNTGVGYNAGGGVTTGLNNTLVGGLAGDGMQTADDCVAIGKSSLSGVATQDGTVAVGASALAALTDGANNVAVGYNALAANTTGGNNLAIGTGVLQHCVDGSANIGIGSGALDDWDVGGGTSTTVDGSVHNLMIGVDAGGGAWTNVVSAYNVGIGNYVMDAAMAEAIYNTSVGHGGLSGLTSGDYNLAVGSHSGDTITTGSNNVFVGFHTEASAVDVTHEIVIGAGVDISNAFAGAGTETCKIGRASDFISVDFGENATWAHSSDVRIKKDIEDSDLGLSFINDLRPVTFKKKAPSEYPETFDGYDANETERKNPDRNHYGFIAQEVKEAMDKAGHSEFPVWSEGKDGMQELGETELITPLIKAIQELTAKVEALENK